MLNRRDFISGVATSAGAMTMLSSEAVKAAPASTVSLNVIYPNHDGARFDTTYYRSTHIPLAMKVLKAASVLLIEGVPMGSTPAPYVMIAHFEFPSAEAMQAALADPAMAGVREDVPKFTDITPTVMLGKSLKELARKHRDEAPIELYDGRYGMYVKHAGINATAAITFGCITCGKLYCCLQAHHRIVIQDHFLCAETYIPDSDTSALALYNYDPVLAHLVEIGPVQQGFH